MNTPSRIRAEVGKYVLCYGTQATRKRFSPRYSEYEIKQLSKVISKVVYEHDIPSELIINLDQTSLSYISPGKYTINIKVAEKRSMTNARLQLHLKCLQLGFLTDATNLHRKHQNMPSKI